MRTQVWVGSTLLMSAAAFVPPAGHAQDDPCSQERAQFCPSVEPGEGRVGRCLREHEADLGQACLAKLKELEARVSAFAKVCEADAKRFCSAAQAGGGRVGQCLAEHRAELSADCANVLPDK